MHLWRFGLLCVIALLSAVSPALAESLPLSKSLESKSTPLNQYALRSWNTRDGLPHNSVNRITQSNQGYLWLATWEGPVRYNGRTFKIFDDTNVTKMREAGALSVAYNPSDDELVFSGPRGSIVSHINEQWNPTIVGDNFVFDTVRDASGATWAATANGVYRIAEQQRPIHYTAAHGLPTNFSFRLFITAAPNQQTQLYVGTRRGLAYYNKQTDSFVSVESVSSAQVRAMTLLDNGTFIVANDDGLFYLLPNSDEFLPWPVAMKDRVTALTEASDGCLIIGTFTRGLGRLCHDSEDWLSVENGLPNSHVLDIYRDQEDTLWIGTHGGLVQLREALFRSFTPHHGVKGAYARSVNTDKDGRIWVGTNDGISHQVNESEQGTVFKALRGDPLLEALSVLSIAHGESGVIYVGTYTDGLLKLTDGKVTAQLSRKTGFSSNEIRVVLPIESTNLLLVGTARGLYLIRVRSDAFEIVRHYSTADGMAADFVSSITMDSAGALWVSSTLSLTYLRPVGEFQWQPKPIDLASFTGASNIFSGTFHNNRIWFATDHGMLTRSLETDDWHWLSRRNGLPFDKTFTIDFDKNDNLWLGGARGILRITRDDLKTWMMDNRKTINYQLFTEVDGMVSRQLTTGGPASVIDQQGSLWFASALGVVTINPQLVDDYRKVSPAPVIESVTIDTGEIHATKLIPADNTRTEFRYVTLGYHMPESLQYQVRLEGYDSHWIDRGNQLETAYTALSPGKYTFMVRSRYPGGEWSTVTSIVLEKQAFFYQRPWFWFVFSITLILLLSLSIHIRIRSLQGTKRRLQRLVQKKTQELEAMAMQDTLTGLANRRAFDQQLEDELRNSRRYETPLTVALIDIDYFKKINDTYLHTGGDVVLQHVSRLLEQQIREVDSVARWGGEEFAIIFPQTPLADALVVLERIRRATENMHIEKFEQAKITVSIGATELSDEESSAQLLKNADRALYTAKEQGRNRIVTG